MKRIKDIARTCFLVLASFGAVYGGCVGLAHTLPTQESQALLIGGSGYSSCYCERTGLVSPEVVSQIQAQAITEFMRELREAGIEIVSATPIQQCIEPPQ